MTPLGIAAVVAAWLIVLGLSLSLLIWRLRNALAEHRQKHARAAIYAQVGRPQHNRALFAPPQQPGDRRRPGSRRRSLGVDEPVHTPIDRAAGNGGVVTTDIGTTSTGRTRSAEPARETPGRRSAPTHSRREVIRPA